jgi:hypothetical protein
MVCACCGGGSYCCQNTLTTEQAALCSTPGEGRSECTAGSESCEPSCSPGVVPGTAPPYDCLNNAFQDGAYVTVSGWSACPDGCPGITPEQAAIFAELESFVNGTYLVPFVCLGVNNAVYTFSGGAACGGTWTVTLVVSFCREIGPLSVVQPHASLTAGNPACLDLAGVRGWDDPLTTTTVPCNTWEGCNCEEFSVDAIDQFTEDPNGTISVTAA